MVLSRRASGFLLGVSAWTAFIWITLIKNIAKDHEPDHGTAFHVVHYVLAAISLTLAVGTAWIGWRGWKGLPSRPGSRKIGSDDEAPVPASSLQP